MLEALLAAGSGLVVVLPGVASGILAAPVLSVTSVFAALADVLLRVVLSELT